MAGRHAACRDRDRAAAARRGCRPAGRCWRRRSAHERGSSEMERCAHRAIRRPWPRPAARPAVGLSIVVPVYQRRRLGRPAGRGAVRAAARPAGSRWCWSTTAARTIPAKSAATLVRTAARPDHLYRARPQFRRAQRGHDRAAPCPRRLRHHHGRRSAKPAGGGGRGCTTTPALGGWDVVYTRYAVKKHAGWRNLGSRFANKVADWLLDKPQGTLSLLIPLHVGAGGAGRRRAIAGRILMSTG